MAEDGRRPAEWSEIKVFEPPNTAGPSRLPPFDDESPKPTPAELKRAFASHIERRHGPDAPLMTKAMREREDIRLGRQRKEYGEARIRIRFSDRTQIEATLPSSSTVPVLYDLLRAHLDESVVATSFTLYQTPPKRDFPEHTKDAKLRDKTLAELGMTPQAALNIRWDDASMNADSYPAPLRVDVRAKAESVPLPPSFQATEDQADSRDAPVEVKSETKKIPKWLKGLQSGCRAGPCAFASTLTPPFTEK